MHLDCSLRRRLFWDALASLFCLTTLLPAPASGQFVTIESHTDNIGEGVCGSPGHRGCSTAPTCTDPSANILRDDLYTGKIQCDLPGATLAVGTEGSLPPILRLYENGAVTPSDTFYTSTDLHFGSTTVSDGDHVRHTRFMNQFANSGRHWPAGVGFPDEPMHPPAAIMTTGDNAHDGQRPELGAYRLLYEQSWINESTLFPVLVGLGNHDLDNDCAYNNCAKRMFDYLAGHVAGGVLSLDDGSHNYSWDWNGVHYLQLNKWAGDTTLGTGDNGDTHTPGLEWLRNDLKNNVAGTGRPVVIFQHFGLDGFSIGQGGRWWTADQRRQFWDIIRQYNVVGMFTGHIHATGMYDFSIDDGLPAKHIDDFVGGTGGQDPCLNGGVNPACGGRGHFFAVQIREPYMDVASLEWRSNADGTDLSTEPYFTNLAPDPYTPNYSTAQGTANDTSQGPAFAFGEMGCRKIINRQLIDVSGLVGVALGGGDTTVTITNASTPTTIPGPLALRVYGTDKNMTNKSFVDRCVAGPDTDPTSEFLYPDTGYTGDLTPGASLTFSPKFMAAVDLNNVFLRVVRVGKVSGSDPATVDLNGTPGNLPPDGTIAVYGPPNTPFVASAMIESATQGWISITSDSSAFDQFGMAKFRYVLNRGLLAADQVNAAEAALLSVSTTGSNTVTNVWVNLHLRAADSIALSASPFPQVPPGQQVDFKAVAAYTPIIIDGGASRITGTVMLNEITNAGTPSESVTTLARGFLNNNDDEHPQPDNAVLFPPLTLEPGIHTLQAVYAGDSSYAPNKSDIVTILVGPSVVNLATNPPGLRISVDGFGYVTPTELGLLYQSTHTLSVLSPQTAPGSRFVFSGWSDQPLINPRQFTVTQPAVQYTANFDAQYQLTLGVNQAGAGAVTADPPSVDGFYPAGSTVTIRATANRGYSFVSLDGGISANPIITVTMNHPMSFTALFTAKPAPEVRWTTPADLFYGTPLSARELNATAPVPGRFVYNPPAGTVLPAGNGQMLTVTFIPADPNLATATATVSINVKPVVAAALDITTVIGRDSANQVVIIVLFRNTGSAPVTGVHLTTAKIGNVTGTPLPQSLGSMPPSGGAKTVVTFPSSVGAAGANAVLTLAGSYTGGSFSKAARIVLP